ncbi:MAG: FtsX-like permease family protein [Vicinamibacterales bacterium]
MVLDRGCTHEIGIRMAHGAQPRDLISVVVRQGMIPALIGLLIGLGISLASTRLLQRLLVGVIATDPLPFAAVPLLLAGVALLACWIPARRATPEPAGGAQVSVVTTGVADMCV